MKSHQTNANAQSHRVKQKQRGKVTRKIEIALKSICERIALRIFFYFESHGNKKIISYKQIKAGA